MHSQYENGLASVVSLFKTGLTVLVPADIVSHLLPVIVDGILDTPHPHMAANNTKHWVSKLSTHNVPLVALEKS